MAKLIGRTVGDVITEYYGPVDGRNYNMSGDATPVAPTIDIQVFGTGSVQLQQTNTRVYRPNAGPNTFTVDRVGDDATWVNLGGVVDVSSGIVTVTPTVGNIFSSIRVVLVTIGNGNAIIQSIWN
jgi:hypothetical protein